MKTFVGIVAGVFLAASASLAAQDAAKIAAGKKVYTDQKCSTCHAIAGVGQKMYPLDGVGKKLSADDTKKWITDPAAMEAKLPKKPPMLMSAAMKTKKLTDADVDALVAYMQSLK